MKKLRLWLPAAVCAGAVAVVASGPSAVATHEPADKAAATANDIDKVDGKDNRDLLLQETLRVSSTSDLILQTTAECSILTALKTTGGPEVDSEQDGAFGQVKLWIEIDGKRVPVSTNDTRANDGGRGDKGEVVFCNRAYQRTVTDQEENEGLDPLGVVSNPDGDGIDGEDDFIRTRTANAFNWMAFNVGKEYDAGGDNVVTVKLFAQYDRKTTSTTDGEDGGDEGECGAPRPDDSFDPYGVTCADAFVGSRSLIIEAVHASNHEAAAPADD